MRFNKPRSVVLLFSGGLDSTFLLIHLLKARYRVLCLVMLPTNDMDRTRYDRGVAASAYAFARAFVQTNFGITPVSELRGERYEAPPPAKGAPVYDEPYRQLFYIARAAQIASELGFGAVATGVYGGKRNGIILPDTTDIFMESMLIALQNSSTGKLKLMRMPYYHKVDMLDFLHRKGYLADFLMNTRWCLNREEVAQASFTQTKKRKFRTYHWVGCGKCASCLTVRGNIRSLEGVGRAAD